MVGLQTIIPSVDGLSVETARIEGRIPLIMLRPERSIPPDGPLEAPLRRLQAQVVAHLADRRRRKLERILPLVAADAGACAAASDEGLDLMLATQAHILRRATVFEIEAVARTFAIVREMSGRILGQRHYDVQLLGAYTMLNGMLAQMATGEGKTLTATLAAGVAALSGLPVHVITVNDYLAKRDADHLRPLYARMGLSVGTIVAGQTTEERQRGYACDIVYITNKEVAFDYLRDRIALGEHHDNLRLKLERLHTRTPRVKGLRLRGLHFALVDEADSVLVDEARTPLIISAPAKTDVYAATAPEAIALAKQLVSGDHYSLIEDQRRVLMTKAGQKMVERLSAPLSVSWRNSVMRDELAAQALAALHLYKRGEHYLIQDEKVQIVDEYTGRVMPDRTWSAGLHQMIEAKEECAITTNRETLARITYQKLFRRYAILSGMSGTLRPIAAELWSTYRLAVVSIPTHRPLQRILLPDRIFATEADKWSAVIERVTEIAAMGAPVLIGTRSVAASEHLSALCDAHGLAHVVLNASQGQQGGRYRRAGRAGRQGHDRHQHGGSRHRHQSDARSARRRWAARDHDRAARRAAHRRAIGRAVRATGGARMFPGLPVDGRSADDQPAPLRCRSSRLALCFALSGWTGAPDQAAAAADRAGTRHDAGRSPEDRPGAAAAERLFRRGRMRTTMTLPCVRTPLLVALAGITLLGTARAETFDCVMEPAQKVKIGSAVTGVLKQVPVQRGDKVDPGQTIAELDDSIEAANLALATTQAASVEGIEAQRARVTLAKEKLDRAEPLAQKDIVSRDKLEGFQADYQIALRDLNAEMVKHKLAQIEVDRAKASVALRVIKSPLKGFVMDKNLLPGEFVNQEAFILTLVQLDPLYIEAYIPVAYYTALKIGMKGTVFPAAPIGGSYTAPVTVVDRVFDAASGTFQVRLELANSSNTLPGGERCKVDLPITPVGAYGDLAGTPAPSTIPPIRPDVSSASTRDGTVEKALPPP